MNYGVIGSGNISLRHIENILKVDPQAKVSLLTREKSFSEEKREKFQSVTNIFFNAKDLLDSKPKAIFICSPASSHIEQAIFYANHGIDIFIEKPLSNKLIGVDELSRIIYKNKIISMVGYVLRFSSSLNYFRKCLQEEIAGEIYRVNCSCSSFLPDWRPHIDYTKSVSSNSELGGGVILEVSHEIDYLRWIFGEPKLLYSYNAKFSQLNIDVEDYAFFLMQFINNQKKRFMCEVALDFFTKQKQRKCIVIGDKGVLEWNGVNNNVTFFNNKTSIKEQIFDGSAITLNDMYLNQTQHFLNCIETRNRSEIDILEGVSTLRILLEAKNKS